MNTTGNKAQAALVEQLEKLKAAAERGEEVGFICLMEMADGTREFHAIGTSAEESPAALESARAVLEALLNGEDPSGGALKN